LRRVGFAADLGAALTLERHKRTTIAVQSR